MRVCTAAAQQQHALLQGSSAAKHSSRLTTVCRGGLLDSLLSIATGSQRLQLDSSEPALSAWLEANEVPAETLKVVPRAIPGQGRGLVASANIAAGERVLSLPEALVLFPSTAAAQSVLSSAPALTDAQAALDPWAVLVLLLAEQRYYLARGQPPSCEWAPYMTCLPPPPLGTILDWTRQDVNTLLAGSGLRERAATILAAADAVWADVQPVVAAARAASICPPDMFGREDFDWATGIALSRTVRLDDAGGVVVLCPLADLANHSVDSAAFLRWDARERAVVLTADRPFKAGEQVTISYGQKSSGDLLLSYGFCPPPGSNPHDAAYISLRLGPRDPLRADKEAAIAARGMSAAQETFGLRIDALPEGLLWYAALSSPGWPPGATAADVQALADTPPAAERLPRVCGGSVDAELLGLQAVRDACKAALSGYPQSLEADRAAAAAAAPALQQHGGGGGFAQRAELMAGVRVRERQILQRSEFVVSQRIRQLKGPRQRRR